MTVKELVTKLGEYNQSADVKVVAHNTMSDFDISFGTSEGCEKETCDTIFLDSYLFQGEPEREESRNVTREMALDSEDAALEGTEY